MTRGKYTQAAAVRHEVQTQHQEIATYQHRVAKLTAEVADLKRAASERGKAHAQAERELRARLDLAAAPKVEALELLNAQLQHRLEDVTARLTRLDGTLQRVFSHLYDGCMAQGQTHEDAIREIGVILGWSHIAGKIEQRALRQARGDTGEVPDIHDASMRAARADRMLERRRHSGRSTRARLDPRAPQLSGGA